MATFSDILHSEFIQNQLKSATEKLQLPGCSVLYVNNNLQPGLVFKKRHLNYSLIDPREISYSLEQGDCYTQSRRSKC